MINILYCLQGKDDILRPECRSEPFEVPEDIAEEELSSDEKIKGLRIHSTVLGTNAENSICDKNEFPLFEKKSYTAREKCDKLVDTDVQDIRIAKNSYGNMSERETMNNRSSNTHSRQSSDSYIGSNSTLSDHSENANRTNNVVITELGNCLQGNIVGLHRKMVRRDL